MNPGRPWKPLWVLGVGAGVVAALLGAWWYLVAVFVATYVLDRGGEVEPLGPLGLLGGLATVLAVGMVLGGTWAVVLGGVTGGLIGAVLGATRDRQGPVRATGTGLVLSGAVSGVVVWAYGWEPTVAGDSQRWVFVGWPAVIFTLGGGVVAWWLDRWQRRRPAGGRPESRRRAQALT